jgi:hypothetical protein
MAEDHKRGRGNGSRTNRRLERLSIPVFQDPGPAGTLFAQGIPFDGLEDSLRPALLERSRNDPTTFFINGALGRPGGGLQLRRLPIWERRAQRIASEKGITPTLVLIGEAGWEVLNELHRELEAWLRSVTEKHAPATWLAVLRRAEDMLLTSFSEDVASGIIGRVASEASNSHKSIGRMRFKVISWFIPPSVLTDLDDAISLSLILGNINSALRRVAKGQQLLLNKRILACTLLPDPKNVHKAVDLYDARMQLFGNPLGATMGTFSQGTASEVSGTMVPTWADLRRQQQLSRSVTKKLLEEHDPFFPIMSDIQNMAPPEYIQGNSGISGETQALSAALLVYRRLRKRREGMPQFKSGSWSRLGYAIYPYADFVRDFEHVTDWHPLWQQGWADDFTSRHALNYLMSPGARVLYPIGRQVAIDAVQASGALAMTFTRTQGGKTANQWGDDFEVKVRNLIDASPWRPPDIYRSLIGKKVKDGSRVITDLDAVAFVDSTLLFIDCKAYKGSPEFWAGHYGPVESMRKTIESASQAWEDRIKYIRSKPEILGLGALKDVPMEGIVVIPFIPYVLPGTATRRVLNLLHVSGISELLHVMYGPQQGHD